jgi:peroxiredoxin
MTSDSGKMDGVPVAARRTEDVAAAVPAAVKRGENVKRIRAVLLWVSMVWPLAGAWAQVAPNGEAPDFILADVTGALHKLSDYKGRYVVLEWFNHDCPFVKKHYGSGNLQSLQKAYTATGVVWLSVCSSAPGKQGHYPPERQAALAKEKGSAATAILLDEDGAVGRLYGAKTTPHLFVVSPKGRVIYQGAIDSIASTNPDDIPVAKNYVKDALDRNLTGDVIEQPAIAPYGCSVKY